MRAVHFKDFANEDEYVDWLVEGLIPNTGWATLTGAEGVGKTRFALQLCAALEQGILFLNMPTKKTRCLYVQVDSPTKEWREIIRVVAPKSNSITVVDVPEFWLAQPRCIEWFAKTIQQVKPGYVVFDSLYRIAPDINNASAIGPMLAQLKVLLKIGEIDVPWLMLHHPPQNESRAAGSKSITGNASINFFLEPTQLKVTKGRLIGKLTLALEMNRQGLWGLYNSDGVDDDDIELKSPFN